MLRRGKAINKPYPGKPREEKTRTVKYVELVMTTPAGILFTFESMDKDRTTSLVDRWMPKRFIQVDEEKKEVVIPEWLYLKEWGMQYE